MSRSHANPPRSQDQQDDVDSRRSRDVPGAIHTASNEMEALRLVNQRHRVDNRPMEAKIPHHRRNNSTSAPLETMTKDEKIVEPEAMIPTYPPRMIKTKERLTETMEVKGRPHIRGEKRNDLGRSSSRISNMSSAT